MKRLLPFLCLVLFASALFPQSNTGRLCQANEELIFSCLLVKNKKIVSVCKDRQGKYLVYRFGTKDKLELEYPQPLDQSSWKAFEYAGYSRGGGVQNAAMDDYTLTFTNKDVEYQLFHNWSSEEDTHDMGIRITVNGKEVVLKADPTSQLGSLAQLDAEGEKIKNTFFEEE